MVFGKALLSNLTHSFKRARFQTLCCIYNDSVFLHKRRSLLAYASEKRRGYTQYYNILALYTGNIGSKLYRLVYKHSGELCFELSCSPYSFDLIIECRPYSYLVSCVVSHYSQSKTKSARAQYSDITSHNYPPFSEAISMPLSSSVQIYSQFRLRAS